MTLKNETLTLFTKLGTEIQTNTQIISEFRELSNEPTAFEKYQQRLKIISSGMKLAQDAFLDIE
jgi:ubiquinone biosynthesis protein Coq4